ncbi:MAG: selenocysteine synthase [Woeseiaceae bacterium]
MFRRSFLKGIASVVPFGLAGKVSASESTAVGGRDYFQELGLTPFINAAGAYSAYGGARMRPEVIAAMRYAATHKVKMRELHDAVGARIASLVGSESAMVTSGATAAMVLGTAACMTLGDEEKMRQLPDTRGLRNEIIIQKKHRYTYDRALTVAGGTLVEVASEDDVRRKINDRTAMMFFLLPTQQGDDIAADRYQALAKQLGIPSFCDAATTTPPAMNVVDGVSKDFDLICYSGGKGLRGPYSAGLLLGREDLIRYARRHSAPNDVSIGRGMKVSSEEYLGMLVALETGLQISETDDFSYKRERFNVIADAITDIPGVSTRIFVAEGHAKELYLDIDWDESIINLTRQEFIEVLRDHNPAVEIRLMLFSAGRIQLSATVMDDGEDVIVGQIIRKTLLAHT